MPERELKIRVGSAILGTIKVRQLEFDNGELDMRTLRLIQVEPAEEAVAAAVGEKVQQPAR